MEDYKKAVLHLYEKRKDSGELSLNLLYPTAARLRNECLVRFKHGCSRMDYNLLKSFFERPHNEEIRISTIRTFDPDKFKPLSNFLNKRLKTADKNIELLAWLIDFQPRPYLHFANKWNSRKETTSDNTLDIIQQKESNKNRVYKKNWKEVNNKKPILLEYPSGVRVWVDSSDLTLIEKLIKLC